MTAARFRTKFIWIGGGLVALALIFGPEYLLHNVILGPKSSEDTAIESNLEQLKCKALAGDARSSWALYCYYGMDDPTGQRRSNLSEAARWKMLAANQGHGDAQAGVAEVMLKNPTPDNKADALNWLRLANNTAIANRDERLADYVDYVCRGHQIDTALLNTSSTVSMP